MEQGKKCNALYLLDLLKIFDLKKRVCQSGGKGLVFLLLRDDLEKMKKTSDLEFLRSLENELRESDKFSRPYEVNATTNSLKVKRIFKIYEISIKRNAEIRRINQLIS